MNDTLLHVALSFVPGMTPALARHMLECGVGLQEYFNATPSELSAALNLAAGAVSDRMVRDEALARAAKEMEFISRHRMKVTSIMADDYPRRLADVDTAPVTLFQSGDASLDHKNMISVVGTRRATMYGLEYVRSLVEGLAAYFPDLCIVSGLALGIDAAAHEAALAAGLPTIAVVAHGLNTIYPAANRDLARRIVNSGGAVISEYHYGDTPFRKRFLERNRIVATMTDAVIVAESAIKGGAMSTAAVASSYGRELLAVPGRVGDEMSAGCNLLISSQKAVMAGYAKDVIETLGWKSDYSPETSQKSLFPELEGEQKMLFDVLRFSSEPMPIDELRMRTGLHIQQLMAALGEMEFDGIVQRHPGNRYSIINI